MKCVRIFLYFFFNLRKTYEICENTGDVQQDVCLFFVTFDFGLFILV